MSASDHPLATAPRLQIGGCMGYPLVLHENFAHAAHVSMLDRACGGCSDRLLLADSSISLMPPEALTG